MGPLYWVVQSQHWSKFGLEITRKIITSFDTPNFPPYFLQDHTEYEESFVVMGFGNREVARGLLNQCDKVMFVHDELIMSDIVKIQIALAYDKFARSAKSTVIDGKEYFNYSEFQAWLSN